MALTPKLEIRQSQSLLMTPRLRQAINLLQLSNLELNELIEQELNNNPLLEKEDSREDDASGETPPTIDDYDDNRLPEPEDDYTPDIDCDNQFDDYASDREGYDNGNDYAWEDYAKRKSAAAEQNFRADRLTCSAGPAHADSKRNDTENYKRSYFYNRQPKFTFSELTYTEQIYKCYY